MSDIERITIVLRANDDGTLEQIKPFVQLGAPVSIGRGMAVIAGASDEDLQMVLGQERDERQMQAELQQQALGAPAHLAAHAQEMHALLRRINVKVGGLNAVLGHGGEPSELMWDEHDEAMDAIWELLAKVQSDASVDKVSVNQIALGGENVNQTTGISVVSEARESLAFGAAPSVITENPAIDPRDLFIAANPVSLAPGDLEKGRSGFVDHRTHADYLIFLAGYQAAQGVQS